MKIAMSSSCAYPGNLDRAFGLAKRLQYDGLEVVISPDKLTQSYDSIARLVDRYELPVLAVHAPCLLMSEFVWGRDRWRKILNSVGLAKRLGTDVVVLHPPFRWQVSYARKFQREITGLCRSFAGLSLENMYPSPIGNTSVYSTSWEDALWAELPFLTLDVSHAAASGVSCIQMANGRESRISHIHLSDGKRPGWDQHLPLGRGTQPFEALLKELNAHRYPGIATHEIYTFRMTHEQRLRALGESLATTRNAIRDVNGL